MEYKADKALIIKAVKLITKAFGDNGIPELEGGIACRALLDNLKEHGLDIQSEPNRDKQN